MTTARIIIHGGFFSEAETNKETKNAKQNALAEIIEKSWQHMIKHSALETAVYAVALLENCELFNAGTGSQIQRDGKIRMSAAIMDGYSLRFSGVINIEDVKNPILVAEQLLSTDDRVLGAEGALQFARNKGFEFFNTATPRRLEEHRTKSGRAGLGTVGCVALDHSGKLAAATSTGGKGFEIPGRISDSATVAGNYANAHCGVSCTGVGEDIVSGAAAAKIVTRVTDGYSLKAACEKTFGELKSFDGFAGAIAVDSTGDVFHIDSHPAIVYATFDGSTLKMFA
jgi:L-asparaginase